MTLTPKFFNYLDEGKSQEECQELVNQLIQELKWKLIGVYCIILVRLYEKIV